VAYSRRVERSGGCGESRISSRHRREDRKRKILFPDVSEVLPERDFSHGEESPREESFQKEPSLSSGTMTPDRAEEIVQSLRELGEDPRALLEMYTPSSSPLEEENRSGHWVDARG